MLSDTDTRQLIRDAQDMADDVADVQSAVSWMLNDLAAQLEQRLEIPTLTAATYTQVVNELAARQQAFITGRRT